MKIAIVYKSITGNTKLLAEAIKEEVQKADIVYFGEPKKDIQADLFIIGSWTDKGMCATEITEFMKDIKNAKVAYFGTAGFGGSEEYYEKLFERIKININDSIPRKHTPQKFKKFLPNCRSMHYRRRRNGFENRRKNCGNNQ